MKIYTVYECEITGEKFFNEKDCAKHEAKEKRRLANEKILRANKDKIERSFADGVTSGDVDSLKKWIEDWNLKNNNVNLEIIDLHMRYNEMASNSHCAPRSGKTNWSSLDKDLPRGYPGFTGQIQGRFKKPFRKYKRWETKTESLESFSALCDTRHGLSEFTDVFKMRGFYSGSGGGGPDNFGYSFTLFIDDFPGLQRWKLKEELKR